MRKKGRQASSLKESTSAIGSVGSDVVQCLSVEKEMVQEGEKMLSAGNFERRRERDHEPTSFMTQGSGSHYFLRVGVVGLG